MAAPKSVRVGGRVPVGVLRAGKGREGSFAALKGGKGSDHHGHLDVGSFVYDADGVRWVIDLGAENYNSIEQAGLKLWDSSDDSQRWDLLRLGTFAHNVFSLDGKNARASGFADIKVDGNTATADLTACYPGAAKAVRTMTLDEKTLTIRDEMEGLAPGTVVDWHFITDSRAEIAGPGVVKLSALGRTRTVSSSAADWKVVSVAEPPHPCESRNPGVVRVSFERKAPASGKVALTVTFGR
ncbi:MAG: heparinase II/III family protein [Kiritimatiellae bacterium]|nr:heparinase II/III family protein [Kiritimatiellia bacterium]